MRSLIDGGRRRRSRDRLQSRFIRRGGSTAAGKDLIRYRRNREVFAREFTVMVLWVAVAAMLLNLARILWRVAQLHLAEQPVLLQASLPGLALVAVAFCLWRARGNWRELIEVHREQKVLTARLREQSRGLTE